jgi:hypothetical protein
VTLIRSQTRRMQRRKVAEEMGWGGMSKKAR